VQPSHPGPGADGKLKYGPFTVHQAMGVVSGYGSTTLSCVFAPSETGAARLPTLISFKSPDQRKLVVPPIEFVLSAIGRDVPIFLDNSVLDFKCSMVRRRAMSHREDTMRSCMLDPLSLMHD
jgi:hypothetical protein